MRKIFFMKRVVMAILLLPSLVMSLQAQRLKITYARASGINFLSYNGKVLLDVDRKIGLPFRPEEFKVIHKGGKAEFGYSQIHSREWDEMTKTLSLKLAWGIIKCTYEQKADSLLIQLQFTNTHSTDTFAGVGMRLLTLELAELPANFKKGVHYFKDNITAPSTVNAVCKDYQVIVENPDYKDHAFVGIIAYGKNYGYSISTGNRPIGGVSSFSPLSELRLAPGATKRMKVAIKFVQPNLTPEQISGSLLRNFREAKPLSFEWKDRRPIGSLFLSSYNSAGKTKGNPRNWSFDPEFHKGPVNYRSFDFRKALLDYADRSIKILRRMNAQGMITWDIEGQEFPHAISYIGSPELTIRLAPEVNAWIDEFFKKFSNEGFKTGLCLRPDSVVFSEDGKIVKHVLVKDPAATLIRKIKYAQARWGCTLFYIDSNVEPDGRPMVATVFEQVSMACPGTLIMPEHINNEYFRFTAPYREMRSNIFMVNNEVKALYPNAFFVLNTADGIIRNRMSDDALLQLMKRSHAQGNIFLFRAWYDDQPMHEYIKRALK